jgi:hypothetical protein
MALSPADTQQLARLNTMLQARDGKPGYTRNVLAIKAEIAALKRKDAKSVAE